MAGLVDKAKNFVADKIANVPKPDASLTDVDFKKVSFDSADYIAKVSVNNPYSHPLPVCEVKYTLKSAGRFQFNSCFYIFFLLSLVIYLWPF